MFSNVIDLLNYYIVKKKILIDKLKAILEVDSLILNSKLTELPEWDSLSSLSVLAMLDSDYGINLTNSDLKNFKDVCEFCDFVNEQSKK